jgi:hypothetical protein
MLRAIPRETDALILTPYDWDHAETQCLEFHPLEMQVGAPYQVVNDKAHLPRVKVCSKHAD